jgi:hypothetical protein
MKKSIKSDRTLLLTSILLFFMLAAGIISGTIGFISGHAALKGVTQPDIRPNNGNTINTNRNSPTRGLELLDEGELITNIKRQTGAEDTSKKDEKQSADAKKQAAAFEKAVKNDPKAGAPLVKLPVTVEDQGIVMMVKNIKPEGDKVKLELGLNNIGSQPINFGGSTIGVTTDDNRTIGGNINGLPGKLAANGKEVKVMLTLPKSSLDKVKSINLQLTDIDKKLQLEASGIPVK